MKTFKKFGILFISILFLFNIVACNKLEKSGKKITENPYNVTDTVIISKLSRSQLDENYFCIIDDKINFCWYDNDKVLYSKMLPTSIMPKGLSNFRFCRVESGIYNNSYGNLFSFYATLEGKEKKFLVGGKLGMMGNQYVIKEYPIENLERSSNYFDEKNGNIYYNLIKNEKVLLIENAKLLSFSDMRTEKDKFWILYEQNDKKKLSTVNEENALENTIDFNVNVLKSGTISIEEKSSVERRFDNKYIYYCTEKAIYLYDQKNTLFAKIDIDTTLYGIYIDINVDEFVLTYAKKKGDIFESNSKKFALEN